MNDFENSDVLDLILTYAAREAACEMGESLDCPVEKILHSRGYSRVMAPLSRIEPGSTRSPVFKWAACIVVTLQIY